ncbi:isocitrate/isopropylmalate dehydrogenase family protein [Accumulibacter sp.]|uniref:isocitrate/isopropylmalate dehydrogenase family protein n=1 Tax=Accumulibacter sp. TaxID=2053492 RepID=UPI001AC5B139|nr:isocitrate/isopropylmalate dehydrogenase family protein [Accumulibacter sp.]MBN8498167.1 isocitrate/isopropylmalate dehydrogenase family protein [Accumulibacter sp.]MBN8707349.1 isocitrate/isopropylmalate dehydrogenase family protein [Bacteroidota bacterium]
MHQVVLIPGDGIGPEITESVKAVFKAADVKMNWLDASAGMAGVDLCGDPLPEETLDLIKLYKVALKGPLTTPVGGGYRSVNVTLRKMFDLYCNIRPAFSIAAVPTPFTTVDMVMFRENTQGLYIGQEKWLNEEQTIAESKAVISREASEKIIRAAFEYAKLHNRKKVTLVHKANILKLTTGLFLQVGKEMAVLYPEIQFEDLIVDNMAMQMVIKPHRFDVVVTTNLFGDILSDLASGLVGGLGVTGSANIGTDYAIFEAVHGSAPDIAGQGKANPTAFLFSACMMLDYLGDAEKAEKIRQAILKALENKSVCTGDIGGKGTTSTFTGEVCRLMVNGK